MKNYFAFNLFLAVIFCNSIGVTAKEIKNSIISKPLENLNNQDSIPTDAFLNQAMLYGMKAIQTGGLATEKAYNPKLKTIGQQMIDQHSKANQELMELAKTRNIALPMTKPQGGQRPDGRVDSAPDNLRDTSRNQNQGEAGNSGAVNRNNTIGNETIKDHDLTQSVAQLKALSGKEFDLAYVNMTIEDYKRLIDLYESGSKTKDKAVRAFAKKALPSLRQQLTLLTHIK
ncbi:DUF4142 domain-containing protein [Pedobacter paludis]|uniref:DUF4142 domain-containing protein n=1 Tax=Pedobacter paludis TaxID=2203212 RepID=A0A317F7A6_9SPHI|nr:DUF4142 domain-containing protein [Pedobacter paludis]PWS33839.1 hypothetical protein DF947_04315 [Pedobacter paludis]